MRAAPLLLLALCAGCQVLSVHHEPGGRTSVENAAVRVSLTSGDRIVAGILIALVVADGMQYYVRGDDGSMTSVDGMPEFEPARQIAVQDCTRPVDLQLGNLLCR